MPRSWWSLSEREEAASTSREAWEADHRLVLMLMDGEDSVTSDPWFGESRARVCRKGGEMLKMLAT